MLIHTSLRTQENNFGLKYIKIFQNYFANVRPQESNIFGGKFIRIYIYMYQILGKKYSIGDFVE